MTIFAAILTATNNEPQATSVYFYTARISVHSYYNMELVACSQ